MSGGNPFAEDAREAHYIRDPRDLAVALEQGVPVKAVCGKQWVPSRDPNVFPVCGTCAGAALADAFDDSRWGA